MRVSSKHPSDKALREFSEAFERLKRNEPRRLVRGTPVSQNNVSREAGMDTAALRKQLYPDLVGSIQEWVRAHTKPREPASPLAQAKAEIADLKAEVEQLRAALQQERDVRRARGLAGVDPDDD